MREFGSLYRFLPLRSYLRMLADEVAAVDVPQDVQEGGEPPAWAGAIEDPTLSCTQLAITYYMNYPYAYGAARHAQVGHHLTQCLALLHAYAQAGRVDPLLELARNVLLLSSHLQAYNLPEHLQDGNGKSEFLPACEAAALQVIQRPFWAPTVREPANLVVSLEYCVEMLENI